MNLLAGKIRDYNAATDTASVEFVHLGHIESWLDGVPIHPAVDRSFVVHGADVTVSVPDPHRLCEAIITASGSQINQPSRRGSAGVISTQTGRGLIATGPTGTGSANVTFSPAFTAIPTFSTSLDNLLTVVLGGLTTKGVTVTAQGAAANGYVYFSWQAQGT